LARAQQFWRFYMAYPAGDGLGDFLSDLALNRNVSASTTLKRLRVVVPVQNSAGREGAADPSGRLRSTSEETFGRSNPWRGAPYWRSCAECRAYARCFCTVPVGGWWSVPNWESKISTSNAARSACGTAKAAKIVSRRCRTPRRCSSSTPEVRREITSTGPINTFRSCHASGCAGAKISECRARMVLA